MVNDQALQITGIVEQIDNHSNYKPMRLQVRDMSSGQTRWFSAFEAVARASEAGYTPNPGAAWMLTYQERPWSRDGKSGVNSTINQAVIDQGQGAVQAPVPVPVGQQPQPTVPSRDALIVRQVAAKLSVELVMAHDHRREEMDYLATMKAIQLGTDDISAIILGTYQPRVSTPVEGEDPVEVEGEPAGEPEEDFLQQEF